MSTFAGAYNTWDIAEAYNCFATNWQCDPCFNSKARDAHGRRTPDLQDIHGQLANLRARNMPDDYERLSPNAKLFYDQLVARFGFTHYRSWAPEVLADSSGKWVGNALRFASKEDALANVAALMWRWTLVQDTRVVESIDPPNYRWVDGGLEALGPAAPGT